MELAEAFWEPGLSRQVVPTLAEFQWKQTDWGLMLNNSDSKGPETPQFIMDHYLLRMYYCYNLLASASVFFDRNLVLSKEAFSCLWCGWNRGISWNPEGVVQPLIYPTGVGAVHSELSSSSSTVSISTACVLCTHCSRVGNPLGSNRALGISKEGEAHL